MLAPRPSISHGRRIVKKPLRRIIVSLGFAAVGGLVAWSFLQTYSVAKADDDDAGPPLQAPAHVTTVNGTPTITLTPAAMAHSGLKTAALENAMHAQRLRAYGSVLDLQSLTDLTSKYAIAKTTIAAAQAKLDFARATLDRARSLYDQGPRAISKEQLERATETFQIAEATLATADSQLQTLAHTAVQTWGTVLGQAVVTASPLVMRLVKRQDILVQITLRADETVAKAPTNAFVRKQGGERIELHFVSAAAATDPHIQGQSYFYTVPAESGLLPGMNIMAYVPTGLVATRAEVPASAIVWLQGHAWAYFRTGPQTLARRQIATDSPAPDGGYYVTNMANGAQVVSHGAQMLLSEEFRAQIPTEE